MRAGGVNQVGCPQLLHREVVTRRKSYKADIWTDHLEELKGSKKLETELSV
jgi:hypothetical protein